MRVCEQGMRDWYEAVQGATSGTETTTYYHKYIEMKCMYVRNAIERLRNVDYLRHRPVTRREVYEGSFVFVEIKVTRIKQLRKSSYI